MKTVSELLPLAIGIAVIGAVTWFLLDRDIGVGRWLLAALLLAHGWVHVMFLFPRPNAVAATATGTPWPFDMGRSWLISATGLDAGVLRGLGTVMIAITLLASVLAALATVGLLVPAGWWAGLVITSAVSSTIVLLLFYAPALVLGFAINLVLIWFVLASVWSPVTAVSRGAGIT